MKFKQPVALVLAGALMCVSLSACSKDEKGAEGADKSADAITSTTSGSETVKGLSGMNTERKQVSYMIGMDIAKSLKEIEQEIDVDMLTKGMRDQLADKPLVSEAQHTQIREAFSVKLQAHAEKVAAELPKKNLEAGKAFLAKNKGAPGVLTTASGLQYQVLRQGSGAKPATDDALVKVHYKGTLIDGTPFDSSYDRNEPAQFSLAEVVPGWAEGVKLMSVGSKYKLWIPSELGWGEMGSPPVIGPNAAVVFEVELLETKPRPAGEAPQPPAGQ
jgi:FKBP-type peptidyl-prolyl cis-trans isomerase FkpA/FKBP-type peptidyl-prolyl cis-trans isomerase FklB